MTDKRYVILIILINILCHWIFGHLFGHKTLLQNSKYKS